MPAGICWALLVAAILNLDRLALGQNAFWRPLVAGAAMGAILGQPKLGLTLGLWVEVLWLGRPPLGGAIVPNGALAVSAAMVGLTLCLSFLGTAPDPHKPLAPLAMALIVPLAHYMTLIEPATRLWGLKTHDRLTKALEGDRPAGLLGPNLRAFGLTFLAALFLTVFGAIIVALIAVITVSSFPTRFWLAMEKLQTLIPLLCLAYMGMGLHRRKLGYYAMATAILLASFSLLSWAL
ncbi:MAG: PTS sugar transporter subunit IIC [Deltaproteobacteria bacterium]|jgi:PTS system mannose-specific IIC component|nr:PTS sugar transporter subunit IIC [Deltaproteobacteria bacterium]